MTHITIDWPEVLAFFAGRISYQLVKEWIAARTPKNNTTPGQ